MRPFLKAEEVEVPPSAIMQKQIDMKKGQRQEAKVNLDLDRTYCVSSSGPPWHQIARVTIPACFKFLGLESLFQS